MDADPDAFGPTRPPASPPPRHSDAVIVRSSPQWRTSRGSMIRTTKVAEAKAPSTTPIMVAESPMLCP